MKASISRRAWWLWPLIYALLSVMLSAKVPLARATDEAAQWTYVESLATTGNLPIYRGQIAPTPGYRFDQPPLYYAICAVLWRALPAGFQNYGCRLICLICGVLTVVLVWKTARLLASDDTYFAHIATGLSALWPLHIALGATANNDALATLICAYLFFLIARFSFATPRYFDAAALGLALGLGVLTKGICLAVGVVALAALWQSSRRAQSSSSADAISPRRLLIVACGIALLLGAPWLMRNTILYGDPFAWRISAASRVAPDFADWPARTFRGWWGIYGATDALLWASIALSLAASAASLCGFVRYFAAQSGRRDGVAMWWCCGLMLIVVSWLGLIFENGGAPARALYPALLPLCIGAARGWIAWGRNRTSVAVSIIVAFALVAPVGYNIFVWKTLL